MLRVGLTGGIATGKSTVAGILCGLGCRLLEADKIAHGLIEPRAAAYDDVVREFGEVILSSDGRVNRAKLAAIVFGDPKRLSSLNAIVHPRVLAEQEKLLAAIQSADVHAIAIIEAALLIEAGFRHTLDYMVVTWCTPEQQLARLTQVGAGRGLTIEQAKQRIAAQMPLEEKNRAADEVIDCSGSLEKTKSETVALYTKLKVMETERFQSPSVEGERK